MTEALYDAAIGYIEAGWAPIPLRGKVPLERKWTQLRPSKADAWSYWMEDSTADGLGIICGEASGGLLVVDIEGRLAQDQERMTRIITRASETGIVGVISDAFQTACALTPSGGRHLFITVHGAPTPPNRKLCYARVDGGQDVLLAEIRGEGGQVAAPPSPGRAWVGTSGPGSSVHVNPDQLALLLDAFSHIDESERLPVAPPRQRAHSEQFSQPMALTVAAALSESLMMGELAWSDVLDPGWEHVGYDYAGRSLWLRPEYGGEKPTSSVSAHGFERAAEPNAAFVVHSTSVSHLPVGGGARLTPGRVFAYCWYGGDEAAAYAALERAVTGGEVDPAVLRLPTRTLDRVVQVVAAKHPQHAPAATSDPETVLPQPKESQPMPRGLLAPIIEAVVDTVVEHTQTPPELATFTALAALSAATAGGFVVECGWTEPLAIYAMAAADPSERKSSVLRTVGTDPLRWAMETLTDAQRPERNKMLATIEQCQVRIAELRKKLKAGEDVGEDLALAGMELHALEESLPIPPDFVLTDATLEALEMSMGEQRGVGAVLSAEGTLMKVLSGYYSDGRANANLLNSAWSHEYHRSARVKRGGVSLPRPHCALALIVQPAVMDLMGNEEFAGTGFTARWLLCHPKSRVGRRHPDTYPLNQAVLSDWRRLLLDILRKGWQPGEPHPLTLTPAALAYLRQLLEFTEARLKEAAGGHRAWLAKSVGQTVRIAGLIALAEQPWANEVDVEHLHRAAQFMQWVTNETLLLLSTRLEYASASEGVNKIVAWVRNTGTTEFYLRELQQAMGRQKWLREGRAEALGDAIDTMLAWGYLEDISTEDDVSRRRRRFRAVLHGE